MIVDIMKKEFGDSLVTEPISDRDHPRISILPSPNELKGRILLKAKNLYVSENEGIRVKKISVDTESESTETSASDSELIQDVKEVKHELKHELNKARNLQAVKGLSSALSPS